RRRNAPCSERHRRIPTYRGRLRPTDLRQVQSAARTKPAALPQPPPARCSSLWSFLRSSEVQVIVGEGRRWRGGLAGRTLALLSALAVRLPVVHGRVPLPALRHLDVRVDPLALFRLEPRDQFLALDRDPRLDVLRRAFVRRLHNQAVDKLCVVAHSEISFCMLGSCVLIAFRSAVVNTPPCVGASQRAIWSASGISRHISATA